MSNISNDAGPFGQGSGEDCADGFTYDDMAPLTEGGQDSKRKPNRFMNKKRETAVSLFQMDFSFF